MDISVNKLENAEGFVCELNMKYRGEPNENTMQMTGGYICEPRGNADGCLCEHNGGCKWISL